MQNNTWKEHDFSDFAPKFSAITIGKLPSVHVFHGTAGSITNDAIDIFRHMFPHHPAGKNH